VPCVNADHGDAENRQLFRKPASFPPHGGNRPATSVYPRDLSVGVVLFVAGRIQCADTPVESENSCPQPFKRLVNYARVLLAILAFAMSSVEIPRRRSRASVSSQSRTPGSYRIVVGSLGLVVLVCAIGAIYLTAQPNAKDVPAILVALGSAAVGALAGLLAPSPAK
jgi:hypothetical protein